MPNPNPTFTHRSPKQILPVAISMWNSTKGGVDQTSRYMKETQASFEEYLSPTQRLWTRMIKIWLLNACHVTRNAQVYNANISGKINGWKQLRKVTTNVMSFEDFLVDASEELGEYLLPNSVSSTEKVQFINIEIPEESGDIATTRKRSKTGVTAYNHRKAWSVEPLKVRCRLAKFWRKQGVGEDDALAHLHSAVPLEKRTTRCVLCCKLCYNPQGKIYVREKFHNQQDEVDELEKKDVGRIGNAATHTCSVCAVHLCNGKGRFPGSSMSCFDLWHCVPNLLTDKRTETLCHVRCPAEGKINIIHKLAGNKRAHLCGGVRRQAASKVVKVGKPTYDLRNNY
jgi:hypothetical protein